MKRTNYKRLYGMTLAQARTLAVILAPRLPRPGREYKLFTEIRPQTVRGTTGEIIARHTENEYWLTNAAGRLEIRRYTAAWHPQNTMNAPIPGHISKLKEVINRIEADPAATQARAADLAILKRALAAYERQREIYESQISRTEYRLLPELDHPRNTETDEIILTVSPPIMSEIGPTVELLAAERGISRRQIYAVTYHPGFEKQIQFYKTDRNEAQS